MFDPLAICLVLAANFAFSKAFPKKRENIYGEKVVITQTPIIELEADPSDLPDLGENRSNPKEEKKTNLIDKKIEDIDKAIKKTKSITKSSYHRKKKLDLLLNTRKKLLRNKKEEDDDLTIIY